MDLREKLRAFRTTSGETKRLVSLDVTAGKLWGGGDNRRTSVRGGEEVEALWGELPREELLFTLTLTRGTAAAEYRRLRRPERPAWRLGTRRTAEKRRA